MSTSSQPDHTVYTPQIIACDASRDARAVARDIGDTVTRIIVFPARKEVLAFINESVTTFQCESLLVVSDVIVGFGFCANTGETLDYLAEPHIMEKSLNNAGISIRPLND